MYDTEREVFYEDITKIDYGNMPDFDLLVGGPCCQSFSVAGRRLAFEDDRGNRFFNYIKILEVKRPKYFIAENDVKCNNKRCANCRKGRFFGESLDL